MVLAFLEGHTKNIPIDYRNYLLCDRDPSRYWGLMRCPETVLKRWWAYRNIEARHNQRVRGKDGK